METTAGAPLVARGSPLLSPCTVGDTIGSYILRSSSGSIASDVPTLRLICSFQTGWRFLEAQRPTHLPPPKQADYLHLAGPHDHGRMETIATLGDMQT